jgi:hypothetical protein
MARLVVVLSLAMLAVGWLPLGILSGLMRHLTPLPEPVSAFLPDAVLVVCAVLGIGGAVVWFVTYRGCVMLPEKVPGDQSESN